MVLVMITMIHLVVDSRVWRWTGSTRRCVHYQSVHIVVLNVSACDHTTCEHRRQWQLEFGVRMRFDGMLQSECDALLAAPQVCAAVAVLLLSHTLC